MQKNYDVDYRSIKPAAIPYLVDIEKEMDENDDVGLSPEEHKFLSEPMTRLEVIQLIQPLRSLMLPLIQASISSISILTDSENPEHRDRARETFLELGNVFNEIETFDKRLKLTFRGKKTWATDEEVSDDE